MKPESKLKIPPAFVSVLCLVLTAIFFFGIANGDAINVPDDEEIFLLQGDLESIKTFALTRISVANPDIADIASIDKDYVLMVAKKQGQTEIFIWDKYGKRSVKLRVFGENLDLTKSRVEYLLSKVEIKGISVEVNKGEGKVVVSGEIQKDKKSKLEEMLSSLGGNILNLVQERKEKDLVQIDAQVAELSTSATKSLGVDWSEGAALTFTETVPGTNIDKPWDAFKLGQFKRTTAISNVLNALITEGKGRILSRPKLVVKSGEEASFLVGGQIPVTTRTIIDQNIIENTVYKDYGIDLTVTPTVTEDTKVDIKLKIDVSDIDSSSAATTAVTNSSTGKSEVAFTTRTVETQLYLDNNQTVVLAGLIKANRGEEVKRIPFFSDVPIFGAIFRNKTVSPNTETELVISLTPTILFRDKKADLAQAAVSKDSFPAAAYSPVPPQETETKTAMIPDGMVSYVQSIQAAIARSVVYPEEAKQYSWEGTVKLALHILSDGTLEDVSVIESSGYDLFDNNALTTAKESAPYAAFPVGIILRDLSITIPIVYSLDTN